MVTCHVAVVCGQVSSMLNVLHSKSIVTSGELAWQVQRRTCALRLGHQRDNKMSLMCSCCNDGADSAGFCHDNAGARHMLSHVWDSTAGTDRHTQRHHKFLSATTSSVCYMMHHVHILYMLQVILRAALGVCGMYSLTS